MAGVAGSHYWELALFFYLLGLDIPIFRQAYFRFRFLIVVFDMKSACCSWSLRLSFSEK